VARTCQCLHSPLVARRVPLPHNPTLRASITFSGAQHYPRSSAQERALRLFPVVNCEEMADLLRVIIVIATLIVPVPALMCSAGTYSSSSGGTGACVACPPGTTSLGGALGIASCLDSARRSGPVDTVIAFSADEAEGLVGWSKTHSSGVLEYVADRFGNPGGAIKIVSSESTTGLSLSDTSALPVTTQIFTFSLWVKTLFADWPPLLAYGTCGNSEQWAFGNTRVNPTTASERTVNVRSWASNSLITSASIIDGNWHFLAVSQAYGGQINVYVDGSVVATGTLTPITSAAFLLLGMDCNAANSPTVLGCPISCAWKGDIDDFRVYDRVLSSDEVSSMYSFVPPSPSPSPTATGSPTASATVSTTATPAGSASASASASSSPTSTTSSTMTASSVSTASPTSTSTPTSSASSTSSPSSTATSSATSTSTATTTSTSSSTASATPSLNTGSSTATASSTSSATASSTSSATASSTSSATASTTSSATASGSSTSTSTLSSSSTSTPSSAMADAATRSGTPSSTPKPPKWVSFVMSFRGADPSALVGSAGFVCTLRTAFSQLSAVPLSAVRLVGVKTEAGTSFPVLVSQLEGSCGNSRQLASLENSGRRIQSLAVLSVEVSVDVSKTTLTISSSNVEQAVRGEIEAAFSQNPSLVDSLFSGATAAACSAQGIPSNLCPNPPSLVLSLSNSGKTSLSQTETGNVLIPAIAGAIGGAVFVAAVTALLWRRASHSKQSLPPPLPVSSSPQGLVNRQVATNPSAPPADDPSLDQNLSGTPSSKRFVVRTVFDPSGTR
jgi:hypothetical protein